MRRSIPLLIPLLLLGACNSPATAPETTTAATTSTTAAVPPRAAEPTTFKGEFTVANTTASGGEVGVTAIELTVSIEADSDWRTVDSECSTDPEPPFVVAEREDVAFTCDTTESLAAGTRYEVAGSVDLFGADIPYEFVVTGSAGES